MEHETASAIRTDNPSRRGKAKYTPPAASKFCGLDGKNPRFSGYKKGQATGGTDRNAANGFLKTAFLPRLEQSEIVASFIGNENIEHDFYTSLSEVATNYGITPRRFPSCGGLLNSISRSLQDFRDQLQNSVDDWQDIRLLHHNDVTFFAREVKLSLGFMLYYIPVEAVYKMMEDATPGTVIQLLLSILSYLYLIVDIPYYRQEGCYVNHMYTMIKEWEENNEDNDGGDPEFLAEIGLENLIGDTVEKEIIKPVHLIDFRRRVEQFKPECEFHEECMKIAKSALALYETYPQMTIYEKLLSRRRTLDEDQDDPYLELDQYVSFYGRGDSAVTESVMDAIDCDLQEYCFADEPVIYETFDGTKLENNDFHFENTLFPLIEDLSYLLYHYKSK